MPANKYGWGIHPIDTGHCPNCEAQTRRYTFMTRGSGVHAKRCYECAPLWAPIAASLSILVIMIGLVIVSIGWPLGVLWPGLAVTAIGAAMQGLSHWPKWRVIR